MKKLIILLIMSWATIQAQDFPLADIYTFDGIQLSDDYTPSMFNFNAYDEIELSEFKSSYPLEDLKGYTMFLVFAANRTNDIVNVVSDEKQLNISRDKIISKRSFDIQLENEYSYIVLYRGVSGKTIKDALDSRIQVGSKIKTSQSGEVNLAGIYLFKDILDDEALDIMNSKLAIKYGISLPIDSTYYDSNGLVIYDGKKHQDYNHDIIALTNDYDLLVSQSTYSNDPFFTVGIGQIRKLNATNHFALQEGKYIFFGHDNGELHFKNDRLERTWEISTNTTLQNSEYLQFKFDKTYLDGYDDKYDYFVELDGQDNEIPIPLIDLENVLISDRSLVKNLDGQQVLTLKRKPRNEIVESTTVFELNSLQIEGRSVKIFISDEKDVYGKMTVFDSNGHLVKSISIPSGQSYSGEAQVRFPGLYYAVYEREKVLYTRKFIIQ